MLPWHPSGAPRHRVPKAVLEVGLRDSTTDTEAPRWDNKADMLYYSSLSIIPDFYAGVASRGREEQRQNPGPSKIQRVNGCSDPRKTFFNMVESARVQWQTVYAFIMWKGLPHAA